MLFKAVLVVLFFVYILILQYGTGDAPAEVVPAPFRLRAMGHMNHLSLAFLSPNDKFDLRPLIY